MIFKCVTLCNQKQESHLISFSKTGCHSATVYKSACIVQTELNGNVYKVLQLNLIRKCDFQTFQEVCLFLVWKFELFNKIERNRVDPRFYELGF